jgi:peptidoglycan/LPS O-acetylase OafA/YrhL
LAHTPNLVLKVPGLASMRNALWMGVDLFMLISGWLLGGQLLREDERGPMRPLRFYFKRWMRTLPPYYFMLLTLYYLPGAPEFHGPQSWKVILTHLTFTQVYAGTLKYMVSWSLCVEEHFYLVLPLVVLLLRRVRSLPIVVLLTFALEALAVASRYAGFDADATIPGATHERNHGLFLGLLFALVNQRYPLIWARLGRHATLLGCAGVVATIAVLATVPPAPSRWMFIAAPTLGTWTFAMVFLPCVHEGSTWSRVSFRGLTYLGGLTYAIYLTHNVLPRTLVEMMGGAGTPKGMLWRFGCMASAALFVHHLVERPSLAIRQRLLARMQGPMTSPPQRRTPSTEST